MGLFGPLFFSELIKQWEAFRKVNTNPKKIAEIDKKIAELRELQKKYSHDEEN